MSEKMPSNANHEPKHCVTCGRPFEWRKKWEKVWPEVRYCSRNCRRKLSTQEQTLERIILELLQNRSRTSSICPSEAARKMVPEDWQKWMEATRQAARRLAIQGQIEITQKGRPVPHLNFKGPIRLKIRV